MGYKYRILQNKIQTSRSFGMWFAKPVVLNNISTAKLCTEVSHSTTITESDVRAILAEVKVKLAAHLLNNESVTIDGLGTFSIGLSSIPTETEKDATASQIKSATVNFKAATASISKYVDDKGKIRKKYLPGLLSNLSFEMLPYDSSKNILDKGDAEKPEETAENNNG